MLNKQSLKFILTFFLGLICVSYGQNNFAKTGDIFGVRTFIKNNGQFNYILPNNSLVDYAYINGNEQVYFNQKGVTYYLRKKKSLTHKQHEAIEHGKKIIEKPESKALVNVSWENSNPNVELIVSEKQSYYYSFGDEKLKSDCYKKITYKNIYKNIDIEYFFTSERKDGIKYNIVIHPGGNVNDIKIKYSGDFKKIVLKNGNVIIKTAITNITELSPTSYQNGLKITSNFKLENNLISFNFPEGFDTTKELVIDPWVTNLTLANNNYGFDVDYDYTGNFYVYGGSSPFLISKYSQAGVLLWTFGGVVPSAGWTSDVQYVGNFIVDKATGKSYTGQGFEYSVGTRIVRLNAAGIYDNFISTGVNTWNEVWDMGYNCNTGDVYGLGGAIYSNASAGILNTTTGSISPQNFTGLGTIAQDVVSHAIDPNGRLFLVFSSAGGNTPSLNNRLMLVNSAFSGNDWIAPSTYTSFSESNNKNYLGTGLISSNSNGFNALAANSSYLYYYDGFNLAAYNKTNGVKVGFTTIAGQIIKRQGGIAVDECNNVYVGGNGFILCYNFNGTTFTANGTIPVDSDTTDKYVTDIKLKLGSNELYVTGRNFGGIYIALNTVGCSAQANINLTQTAVNINNTNVTVVVTTSVVSPIITYTWLNSNNTIVSQTINSPLLTNTVSNLPDGTYTVLMQINAPCGPTVSQVFIVGSSTAITPMFTQVNAICYGTPLAELPTTSNNGIVGTWSPALNNTATTTYTFTPAVGQNANPILMTITVHPIVAPTFTLPNSYCSGETIPALPTTSNEGIVGTWSPSLNNLTTTTYTFTPTSSICTSNAELTINITPNITPNFDLPDLVCWNEVAPVLPLISLNGITGTWLPSVISNTLSGDYQFTPNLGQCAITPAPISVTVSEDFNFYVTQECVDKNFILQVIPVNNSFDSNSVSIFWQNNNNVIANSSIFNVTNYLSINSIIPQFPIQFTVNVTLPNGCLKSEIVSIDKVYCGIQKGISPNGDNNNDYFDLELLNVKNLEIFNRYGVKVYSKAQYKKEWYGQTNSGKILPDGIYYYIIEFNSKTPTVTGWIYLINQN